MYPDTIDQVEESEIYSAVGSEGFDRLTARFYEQVPADDILGPMYPASDLEGARTRLRDFLMYRFGGPPAYIERRGHPRLRVRHAPFSIDQEARNRWLQLMSRALERAMFPPEAEQILRAFFESTSTFLINK